jgi:hypothetical protein
MKKLITIALVSLMTSCSSTQYFAEWKQEIKTDMDSKFGEVYAVTDTRLSPDQPVYKVDVAPQYNYNPDMYYYYLDNYHYNMYQLNTSFNTWRYSNLY